MKFASWPTAAQVRFGILGLVVVGLMSPFLIFLFLLLTRGLDVND